MRDEPGRLETGNSQVAGSHVSRVSIFVFLSIVPQRRHESALIARHHHHSRRGKGARLFNSDHGSQPVPNQSGTAPASNANAAQQCRGGQRRWPLRRGTGVPPVSPSWPGWPCHASSCSSGAMRFTGQLALPEPLIPNPVSRIPCPVFPYPLSRTPSPESLNDVDFILAQLDGQLSSIKCVRMLDRCRWSTLPD